MPKILSLDKSITLLETILHHPNGIGTRSLTHQLGYNVATVHNIAMTFLERGYLQQDPQSKRFFPGIRLAMLSRHPSYSNSLIHPIRDTVEKLSEELNESVLLGSIEHGRIINLLYLPSKQALRVHEPEDLSDHSHCTAFGKILLSALSDTDLESHLHGVQLQQFTASTLTTAESLKAELAKVRSQGYAQTKDEYCEGISAIAVPIHDPWGAVFASIGASAPTIRMQKEGIFQNNLAALQKTAKIIEATWNQGAPTPPEKPPTTKA